MYLFVRVHVPLSIALILVYGHLIITYMNSEMSKLCILSEMRSLLVNLYTEWHKNKNYNIHISWVCIQIYSQTLAKFSCK